MAYINNQYIRLEKPLEEISKIEIKIDENNKLIEDLEIEDYPNVIIAYGKKVDYNNIFGGVKILITDKTALKKSEYVIPEYIESIIVYGYLYENKKEEIERLKNGIELMDAIRKVNEKLALKILEREEININQVDEYGNTALICACKICACRNKMERVALKLLEREEININQVNNTGNTALIWACFNKMELVLIKWKQKH